MNNEITSNFNSNNYSEDKINDILFNKLINNKVEQYDEIINNEFFAEFISQIWYNRNEIFVDIFTQNDNIDNISIELNNKIIEVLHFFKKNNISYYQELTKTSLSRLVTSSLFDIYSKGFNYLKETFELTEQLKNKHESFKNSKEASDFFRDIKNAVRLIEKYQVQSNKLWDFNFEKNILSCIIDEFYACEEKETFKKDLKIYIEELKQLGLNSVAKEAISFFKRIYKESSDDFLNFDEENEKDNLKKEEDFFKVYQKRIEIVNELLNEKKLDNKKIYNIGTLLNNKVVEIYHIYKKKNINFYSDLKLKDILLKMLDEYYDLGYYALYNDHFKDYNKYCSRIYLFNMENDIVPFFKENKNSKKYINSNLFKECKNELSDLGYLEIIER